MYASCTPGRYAIDLLRYQHGYWQCGRHTLCSLTDTLTAWSLAVWTLYFVHACSYACGHYNSCMIARYAINLVSGSLDAINRGRLQILTLSVWSLVVWTLQFMHDCKIRYQPGHWQCGRYNSCMIARYAINLVTGSMETTLRARLQLRCQHGHWLCGRHTSCTLAVTLSAWSLVVWMPYFVLIT
ncbi:hypothetical protein J6590_033251 [Homalodisca vitripennis]|nr:hypothetical protein J6590_033251 [Homalodisca vitripennis]